MAEPQRRRLGELFELGPKRRRDVLSLLDHALRLDPKRCTPIPPGEHKPGAIAALLAARGAGESCHVVGAALDGEDAPLGEALERLVGGGNGFFISCLPGRLGYYEYEEPGARFLLCRVPAAASRR